jgi:hypothetical protein
LFEAIVEQADGSRRSRVFDPHLVPMRFQVIGRRIGEIEEQARKTLVAGLRLDFALRQPQIGREQPLGIEVRLTALGSSEVPVYNPLLPPPKGHGEIMLNGVRSDIRPQELQFHHRRAQQLKAPTATTLQAPGLAAIQPGEPRTISFSTVLDWPPGAYSVHISMEEKGPTEAVPGVIVGRIVSLPQQLVVTGGRKPDDEGATHYEPPVLK